MARQRSFFRSLQGKITWKMLAVSLVPVIIIGAITYTGMANLQEKTDFPRNGKGYGHAH